jgi:hypothetical protein
VAIFLRKLEYFDGILFLTANLVNQFDEAILSRVHLVLKYEQLDRNARKTITARFLMMAKTDRGPPSLSDEDIDRFAELNLNGRQVSMHARCKRLQLTDYWFQIKNTVAIAHALAVSTKARLSYSHICQALEANNYRIPELSNVPIELKPYE